MFTKSVPQRYKIIFYVLAWLLALFATDPNGKLWSLAYMFPLGLAAFINPRWGNDGGWGVLAACTAIYLAHGYFFFRSRKLWLTLVLFVALILLFICNVSGCHTMYKP